MSEETKIIRIIVDSSKAIDGSAAATRALQNLERQTGSMDSTLAKMEKSLASVGAVMMAGLALAIGEIASRLIDMTTAAFKAASGLDEMAEQVGLNSRQLQGLQFAAVQAGVKLETLETGVAKFSKKIGDAATGDKAMIESLDRLGVKILDTTGKLRPTADLMQETAQKIGEIDDPAKKAAAAVEFFGKTGQRMLTMLDTMSKGLFEASDAAEKFGAMISDRTSKKLDEIADAMERAKLKTRAFLAEGLMAIIDFAEQYGIVSVLEKMAQGFAAIFKFPVLLANAPQLGDFVDSVRSGFDKLLIAGVRFGAAIAEQFKIVWEFLDRNGLGAVLEAMQRGFESLVKTAWTLAAPLRSAVDGAKEAFDQMMVAGARFGAAFIETFKAIPSQLGQLFRDGVNNVLMALESGLPMITGAFEKYAPWLGVKTSTINLGRLDGSSGSGIAAGVNDYLGRVGGAADRAEKAAREQLGIGRDYAGDRARQRLGDADRKRAEAEMLAANNPAGRSSEVTPGASNPAARGAGDDIRKRLDKLDLGTARDLEAARDYANASQESTRAVAELEIHTKALKAVQDAYGDSAKTSTEAIRKKTAAIEEQMRATEALTKLKDFNVATDALRDQNALLAAENRLIGANTEDRARELAIIKATQEFAGKGLTELNAQQRLALQNRVEQLTIGEKLKAQGEELRQSVERWSAPWKNAFQSIQQAGADAWERILQGGRLTFESIADVARVSLRRVAAELINLATIRPLIGFGAQALGSLGILSPSTVQSMGFGGSILGGAATGAASGVASAAVSGGSSGSGGLLGGIGTGFGFGNLFSGGSTGGGFFGSVGNWLNSPIGSAGYISGMGPAGQGLQGLAGAGPGMLGNLTPLGAIGGLASMGFGAYNLATAKTPLGALGGGLGLVGGGLGLAAAAGLIGSAFGPIGMGIGLLGGLLGLFGGGGDEPPIPPQPELVLNIGGFMGTSSGRFYSAGSGSGGGGSLRSTAQGVGSAVSRLFRASDVSPIPGQMFGGSIISGVDHVLNGRNWQDRPYTQAGINPPGGGVEWVTYNDPSRNAQQAADLLVAAVFRANVMRGGVSGATETLKAGLTAYDPQTAKDTQTVVALAGAYDKLGKVTGSAKEALEKITASFDDLADFADRAGLAMKPITKEIEKQSKRWAQDFLDNMLDPLAAGLRALGDERDSAIASAEYIRAHVEGVYVDMDRIATYYTNKEAQLRDQFYQGAVENLQNLIARLSYGDLANASPDTSLTGVRGTYLSTLAQARAGVATAITSLPGVAETYATSARGYFASSPEYAALVADIRRNLEEVVAVTTGGGTPASGAAQQLNEASQTLVAANEQLREIVSDQSRQVEDLKNMVSTLVLKLGAIASNRM